MRGLRFRLLFILPIYIFVYHSSQAQGIQTDERNFKKISALEKKHFEGTPIKGNHKRFKRAEYHLRARLNENGELFNYTKANMEALQQLYIDTFPAVIQGDWVHVGPLNTYSSDFNTEGVGRVNDVAFASASTWYAATAGGGLWRTDIAGFYIAGDVYPWYSLTDSLPVMSISGVEVNPNDIDDVYILTGDGDASFSFGSRGTQPGIGILRSTDGGSSWNTTALQYGTNSLNAGYKLVRYPGSADTMFAACTDNLYRTTDGWQTQLAMINPIPGGLTCFDVEFRPNDPQTVYAACAGSLWRSTNGGVSFTNITGNMQQANITPNSMITRMAIAVTPADPNYLYVIMAQSNGGLLTFQVSPDGGNTFFETNSGSINILSSDEAVDAGGQGNYDLAIWADPGNVNTVIVGGVNIWRSDSQGVLWSKIVDWRDDPPNYTHADVHGMKSNPFSGDLFAFTDGGIYATENGGSTWSNKGRGLGIMQYYQMDVYRPFAGIPFVAGGSQDNGTSAGFGIFDNTFEMIGGGDGFRVFRGNDEGDPIRYRSIQNGKLYRQRYVPGFDYWDEDNITPDDQENADGTGRGAWNTPYQPNWSNFNEVVAGYDDLYYSGDQGDDWGKILLPGGYDGSEQILELEWSRTNSNVLYFYVEDGTSRDLYKCEAFYVAVISGTVNSGVCTVENLNTVPNMGTNTVADIDISPYNDTEVWISFEGYNDTMRVFYNPDMTTDTPWVNLSYNLPSIPVHCINWDVDGIFAGTDIGVFYLPHGEEQWIYFSKGLPTVGVTEIRIANTIIGKQIYCSTWGRGIWRSTPPVPVRRTRWYVDQDAVGIENGANWTNAFTDLQTALDTVQSGDSIWVAEGTYMPTSPNGFSLAYDNVFIWGGFDGTESAVDQRDFKNNLTILSGDIGVSGDSLDNANHVFYFDGKNGNVLLDGFHITEGYAHGTFENSNGAGIYYTTNGQSGKPIISNCKIYRNSAFGGSGYPSHYGYGAGIYISDFVSGDADMYIINCTFEDNFSPDKGGGIYIDCYKNAFPQDTGTAVVHLTNCSIKNNYAFFQGGGLYVEAVKAGTVKLFIDSSIIEANQLGWFQGDGVGVYFDLDIGGRGNLELEVSNSNFIDNIGNSNTEGGAMYIDCAGATFSGAFNNCYFENNSANAGGAIQNYGNGGLTDANLYFEKCMFTSNSANSGGGIIFTSINQASTETTFLNCDFIGNTAVQRGGAIHYNGESGHFISVMDSCTFSNNQANENGAIRYYSRAQTGPSSLSADISNSLFEGNTGSGAATGGAITFWADRAQMDVNVGNTDFLNNATGSQGGAVAHVHTPNDTSYIAAQYTNCDFNSNSTPTGNGNFTGGAMASIRTDLSVSDCKFINNQAKYGGAVYNQTIFHSDSYPYTFSNCQFIQNNATTLGGAIYNDHDNPSEMVVQIINCVFDSNYVTSTTAGDGGAIYSSGDGIGKMTISQSTFTDNSAKKNGGALYLTSNLSVSDTTFITVVQSTFSNNFVENSGETIEIFASGANSKMFSNWLSCDFYAGNPDVLFLNRTTNGESNVTFENCNFYLTGGVEPPPMPIPYQRIMIQNH